MSSIVGQMTRAGGGELEDVNKDAFVGVAGIVSQHPVVDKFLGTLGLVARGHETASRVRCETRLHPRRLGVVVDVIHHHPPLAVDVTSTLRHSILDVRGAQVTLRSDPVARIVGGWTLK